MNARRALVFVLAASLTACGGGAGGSGSPGGTVVPPPVTPPPPPPSQGAVRFSVTVPLHRKHRGAPSPRFVSPNTQSMSVAVNGGALQPIGLTPSTNPNCSGNGTTTPIVCTNLTVKANPGSNVFHFRLYEQALSGGKIPSAATVLSLFTTAPITIVPGKTNNLGTFTMNPVLATLGIAVKGTFAAGTPRSNVTVTLVGQDPSGATIIAPGSFVDSKGNPTPVTLSSSLSSAPFDTALTFSLDGGGGKSSVVVNGPADFVKLDYTGLSLPSATSVSAIAGGIAASAPLTVTANAPAVAAACARANDACAGGSASSAGSVQFTQVKDSATLTPSEVGWTGSPFSQFFTLTTDTCNTTDYPSATGDWATISPGVGQGAASFKVTAKGASSNASKPATCNAIFTDGVGQTVVMDISVTLSGVGVH